MLKGLTFDDVLISPSWSSVNSRMDVDISSNFSRNVPIAIPVASANMRTVTDANMCNEMNKIGGIGILHRYFSINYKGEFKVPFLDDLLKELSKITCKTWGLSIGPKFLIEMYEDPRINFFNGLEQLIKNTPSVVVIDAANAGNDLIFELTKKLINTRNSCYWKFDIVIGNIATPDAARRYKELDIDGIKVGIGPGAGCITRLIAGVGIPQLTAIMDIARVLRQSNLTLIADGGITKPGDLVKALAAGASCVMLGKVLSYANESPGWTQIHDKFAPSKKQWHKIYQGEASFSTDRTHEGVKQEIILPPGVNPKSVKEILSDYEGGLRSGLSYCNSNNIGHLQENAEFIEVSQNTIIESHPR